MTVPDIAALLAAIGCPTEKSLEMAQQLDRRAHQLAEQKGKSYEEALTHLLNLMKQGWAAKEKEL
jgi:hypothetical protein